MQLKGGYAGIGALDLDARDIAQYESILSGDLLGDDVVAPFALDWQHYNENSLHVVTVLNGSASSRLEGLVIASSRKYTGGENVGGGVFASGGRIQLNQCTFRHCGAYRGAALGTENCVVDVAGCNFLDGYGNFGAAASFWNSTGVIANCHCQNNLAVEMGGSFIYHASSMAIVDCAFVENAGYQAAPGGAIDAGSSKLLVERCVFQSNGADKGGAVYAPSGDFTFRDCQFIENAANWAGSIWAENQSLVKCYDCSFTGSYGHFDSGAIRSATNSLFVNCDFTDSFVYWDGGGAVQGGGTFVNCSFNNNQSYYQGGGAIRVTAPMTLVNCLFDGNWTYGPGGAVRVSAPNQPPNPPPFFNSDLKAVNCVFASNTSVTGGGGLAAEGPASIVNSIIWNNAGAGSSVDSISGSPTTVQYSCVQGGWSGAEEGDIAADPVFVSLMGQDGVAGTLDDDLHLMPESPCIDAGTNFVLPPDIGDLDGDNDVQEPLPLDFDLLPRRINDLATSDAGIPRGAAIVDLGPFEYQPKSVFGDVNGDGQVDIDDLFSVINQWGDCPPPSNADGSSGCSADIVPAGGDGEVDDLMGVINGWT